MISQTESEYVPQAKQSAANRAGWHDLKNATECGCDGTESGRESEWTEGT
jgi:hypothetical protein